MNKYYEFIYLVDGTVERKVRIHTSTYTRSFELFWAFVSKNHPYVDSVEILKITKI